ncbi:hypothetical protein FRC0316_00140 [Corynebacterium diphtheriae]|nr:hypothetical protein FRC0295_00120 [Corynebacterium diphtheriae]CAB0830552.1 hypothetical protein FRC0316_00140 [Corynebacterium diphtheriae]
MTMRTYKNPYPDSEDAVEIRFDHCREDIAKAAKEFLPTIPTIRGRKNDSFSAHKHRLFNAPAFQPD